MTDRLRYRQFRVISPEGELKVFRIKVPNKEDLEAIMRPRKPDEKSVIKLPPQEETKNCDIDMVASSPFPYLRRGVRQLFVEKSWLAIGFILVIFFVILGMILSPALFTEIQKTSEIKIRLSEETRKTEELELKKKTLESEIERQRLEKERQLSEEKRKIEEARLAQEQLKTEAIKAGQKKAEIEQEKIEKEQKIAEEKRKAEELKLTQEKEKAAAADAEKKKIEEERKKEELRIAEEKRKAEEQRIAEKERKKKEEMEKAEKEEQIRAFWEKATQEAEKLRQKAAAEERKRLEEERIKAEEQKKRIAKITLTNTEWSYGGNFFRFQLAEENGIGVVFNRAELRIWKLQYYNESPQGFKQRQPLYWEIIDFSLTVEPSQTSCEFCVTGVWKSCRPDYCSMSLKKYREWLQEMEWIEVTLRGTDDNGHPVSIILDGYDEQ